MDEYLAILDKLFTPQQQTALVVITFGVMSLTQAFKNIYFGFYPTKNKAKRKAILWLAAFSFGASGGYIGFLTGAPAQPLWFWIFCGVSAGGFAIGLFQLIHDVIMPRLRKPANG